MSLPINGKKTLRTSPRKQEEASSKRKRVLLPLLLAALFAGLGAGAFFLLRTPSANPGDAGVKKAPFSFSSILKKITQSEPKPVFSFQGTLIGEKGAVAMINDEMAAAGAEIDGVRIVEIDGENLIVEHRGKPYALTVGESFDPDTSTPRQP
ncbi:MAG: hypothetical protein JEZ10_08695 [Verrucomicrobia bacterium]|nr:hypothetical protein [Verrucomicrobiota bacterium]